MNNLERYLAARLINLKNSLSNINPFEQPTLFCSIESSVNEIEFALKISRNSVVNNMRVGTIIETEESKN